MFTLTGTERLVIVAASSGILCVVTFLTICFVCPFCWVNKKLQRRSPDSLYLKGKNYPSRVSIPPYFDRASNSRLLSYEDPPPPYEHVTLHHMELVHLNSAGSTTSETSIPLPIMSEMNPKYNESSDFANQTCGSITLCLKYWRPEENIDEIGKLEIIPKVANDLPIRPYDNRCDTFLEIQINKNLKRKHRMGKNQRELVICRFETAVRRRTQNPMYDECFLQEMNCKEMAKYNLKITVWDKDKFANDTVLGEASINLKEIFDSKKSSADEFNLRLQLKEPKLNNGEILLGLCYLPTAERITVAILKVNNLKLDLGIDESGSLAYVQAMAIHSGKIIEKRKTSSQPFAAITVFNEMLMFDVPSSKLESIVLLISIRSKSQPSPSSIISNYENDQKKHICIGKVLIGSCCKKSELQHWNAMKNSPRKQVMQWHLLR